jgi:hypothetical protein
MLGEAIARELSQRLEVPIEVAVEMVGDVRLMNEDIDAVCYDETDNTVQLAKTLCERMFTKPELLSWLDKRARLARQSIDSPAS